MLKKRIVKRLLSIAAVAVMAFGINVALQSPAAAWWTDCPVGHGCMWTGTDASGTMLDLPWSTYYGHCWNLNAQWNDVVSSMEAGYGSGYGIFLYRDAGCSVGLYALPHEKRISFHNGDPYNDKGSSFRIVLI